MEFLSQYGLFALKSFTLAVAIIFTFGSIIALRRKPKADLSITSLNKDYDEVVKRLEKEVLGKRVKKPKTKQTKSKAKKNPKPVLYVLDFHGDLKASQVESLRTEISAIVAVISSKDEVLIRLESPGGTVNGYGLAASQLQRLRDRDIHITACIDKIAASGGYLMACVANQILAAPFSIIGSIGVVAQMPNFHRWLQKHDIDVELITAGEYKRTLTALGKNTAKGRAKFQEDLEMIHTNFRQSILNTRADINIDEVATGEHWLATDALALKLVDGLQTSDEYIIDKLVTHDIFHIKAYHKQSVVEKLLKPATKLLHPFA
ncbi:MAG: protease SohB [Gammaproteobacteria bacterium]|nr:protease SohB [Gammaproteobacteria bacterium]